MFTHRTEHLDQDMVVVQVNLDNMNPEISTFLMDKLFELGANDVFWIPIIMKKGRPGMMLNVLVHTSKLADIEECIFNETTTLGLRYYAVHCHRLGREHVTVQTKWGGMQVKTGYFGQRLVQYSPEYQECERVAKLYNIPLKTVYNEVLHAFRIRFNLDRDDA